jgi:hypothetical protein
MSNLQALERLRTGQNTVAHRSGDFLCLVLRGKGKNAIALSLPFLDFVFMVHEPVGLIISGIGDVADYMDITIDAVTFAVWWGGVSVVIVSFIEEINPFVFWPNRYF